MSNKKYSEKIKYDFAVNLITHIDQLVENKSFYEAFILQVAVVEYLTRIYIKMNVPEGELYNQYYEADQYFSELIKFFYILSEDDDFYRNLKTYSNFRNRLIHNILEHDSLIQLNKKSKTAYKLGEEIIDRFRQENSLVGILDNADKKYNIKQKVEMFH